MQFTDSLKTNVWTAKVGLTAQIVDAKGKKEVNNGG